MTWFPYPRRLPALPVPTERGTLQITYHGARRRGWSFRQPPCPSSDSDPAVSPAGGLFVSGLIWQLSTGLYLVLDLLLGQDGCEFFHLKDLADFDFGVDAMRVGATLDPLDGLFEGLDLPDPEAGDKLLGLGEGAVDDGARLAGELDACALGAGMEAIHCEHDAGLDELFVVLAHLLQELWIGEGAF